MPKKKFFVFLSLLIILSLVGYFTYQFSLKEEKVVHAQAPENSWYMAAGNPERTSWTPEEVRGDIGRQTIRADWYKVFDPFIMPHVQLIMANDTVYVATARGLYALDANTGAEKWVYPTEMPLGHSPTVVNGTVYVGGLDGRMYAINEADGNLLWAFEDTQAGFYTNPLVVNNVIYAGNRDGYMYAIYSNDHSQKGQLKWKYKTDGPINYSAAYKDNTIYFGSNDSYAYALNVENPDPPVWKQYLPIQDGFRSYWPVIKDNVIIYSAGRSYRALAYGSTHYSKNDEGTFLGPDLGNNYLDGTNAMQYFEQKPWKRMFFVLDRTTGEEISYDFDGDGQPEYAPLLHACSTNDGPRYPPAIGPDGRIYTCNMSGDTRGDVSGWELGTNRIYSPKQGTFAGDEPVSYSIGGNLIYRNLCMDRVGGWFDINTGEKGGLWSYWHHLGADGTVQYQPKQFPGYDVNTVAAGDVYNAINKTYGGWNGVYGYHGDTQNPPIPYKGKIFTHKSNSVLSWSPTGTSNQLPRATVIPTTEVRPVNVAVLQQKLEKEIQKILDAGHLRAGYGFGGHSFAYGEGKGLKGDYWHNPSETIYVLTRALPHLSSSLQTSLRTYIQNEFNTYPPYQYSHIGYSEGAPREIYYLPPEVQAWMGGKPASTASDWNAWNGWPPFMFYALWKYSEAGLGDAKTIFDAASSRLSTPPANSTFDLSPEALNAFIAGYRGYMELEKMAGYTTDINQSSQWSEYNRMLDYRVTAFNKDTPTGAGSFYDTPVLFTYQFLAVARNFLWMTPELGQYLHDHALTKVQEAYNEYKDDVAPYWFINGFEATSDEGTYQPVLDYNGMFLGKALILKDSMEELAKYIDVPHSYRGDLNYIHNLVLTLEAEPGGPEPPVPTPTPTPPIHCQPLGDIDCSGKVNALDLSVLLAAFGKTGANLKEDLDDSGKVNALDLSILLSNFGKGT